MQLIIYYYPLYEFITCNHPSCLRITWTIRNRSRIQGNPLQCSQQNGTFSLMQNGHQEFDENVYNEIWEECREDSFGKVEIRDFVDVVYRARHILSNRVVDSNSKNTLIQRD